MACLQAGMQLTALTNGAAARLPDSMQQQQQQFWFPASTGGPSMMGAYPELASAGDMLPIVSAQNGPPGSYEGQLVSHIMQYINNLWRVDPGNFAATLNMICMRAPALMQRMMDHEMAANAAVDQRHAAQQQQQQHQQQQQSSQQGVTPSANGAGPSLLDLPPSTNPLQHPHELEVQSSPVMAWFWLTASACFFVYVMAIKRPPDLATGRCDCGRRR